MFWQPWSLILYIILGILNWNSKVRALSAIYLLKFGSAFWLRHINHLYNLQYGISECGEHAWSQISNFDRLEAVFYISSFQLKIINIKDLIFLGRAQLVPSYHFIQVPWCIMQRLRPCVVQARVHVIHALTKHIKESMMRYHYTVDSVKNYVSLQQPMSNLNMVNNNNNMLQPPPPRWDFSKFINY